MPKLRDKVALSTNNRQASESAQSQSERFIAKARELGLDEREEASDAALTKVARHKPGAGKNVSPLIVSDDDAEGDQQSGR